MPTRISAGAFFLAQPGNIRAIIRILTSTRAPTTRNSFFIVLLLSEDCCGLDFFPLSAYFPFCSFVHFRRYSRSLLLERWASSIDHFRNPCPVLNPSSPFFTFSLRSGAGSG